MFYISSEDRQQLEVEAAFDQWQYENGVGAYSYEDRAIDEADRDEDARFISELAVTVEQSF